ncbi:MAG: hypothetical protein WC969_04490 [Elusimicrobiota bacterium]|jgi:hypothetical protein
MTHCKYCGCSGWFFALNPAGLCGNCAHIVGMEITQRKQHMRDALDRADHTVNPHTRLARIEEMLKDLEALSKYEEKGIPTIEGSPKDEHQRRREQLDALLLETAQQETDSALARVVSAEDAAAKTKVYSDLLLRLADYREKAEKKDALHALERKIRDAVLQIELDGRLLRARNEEARGSNAEALALYQEALTYLKALDMDVELRIKHVARINGKVKELKAKLS